MSIATRSSWCFDEECRRIRMIGGGVQIESKPFSYALEALSSDKKYLFLSETEKCIEYSFYSAEKSSSRVTKKLFGAKKMRSIFGDDCMHRGVDAMTPSTNNIRTKGKRRGLKLEREGDADVARKKIDLPSESLDGFDAVLEANRLACNRLVLESSPTSLEMIISSLEHDCRPTTSQPIRRMSCLSPSRMNMDVLSNNEEEQQGRFCTALDPNPIACTNKSSETNDVFHSTTSNDDGNSKHYTLDSVSDNGSASTPSSINRFNVPESSKYQEEHESPVSVLDQIFAEDHIHKSSNIIIHIDGGRLKPRRLCFEECSSHRDKQDEVSQYVHQVLEAASLNWDQVSSIRPLSEQLLHSSLYHEVEHLFSGSHFNTRLLFDRMNEVLLQIQRSNLVSATEKRSVNRRSSLEETVVDEMFKEAEFYETKDRTLDQIVAKDVADCRLWFDLESETEHDIMIQISEHILEESIVDVMLDIHC